MERYLTDRYLRLPDGTLPHLGVKGGDVAPYVLLTGNPERLEKMIVHLDDVRTVGRRRGYIAYTGFYRGVPVTAATSGVGAPSMVIALEELADTGGEVFIRVGSCASIAPDVPVGAIIIATAGVRDEGASHAYAPAIYPAVADHEVVTALRAAAQVSRAACHIGLVRSTDSFYTGERDTEVINRWRALRVLAFEMESSALFTIAAVLGRRSGSILVPGSNLITGQSTYRGEQTEQFTAGVDAAIAIAFGAIERLHQTSGARG